MFGTQQYQPQQYQYGTVGGYYPLTTDWTGAFNAMMPMIMMIMMLAIVIPMLKGITSKS